MHLFDVASSVPNKNNPTEKAYVHIHRFNFEFPEPNLKKCQNYDLTLLLNPCPQARLFFPMRCADGTESIGINNNGRYCFISLSVIKIDPISGRIKPMWSSVDGVLPLDLNSLAALI